MIVPSGGWGFRVLTVITLTAGTAFLMWLGGTRYGKGHGKGISLIIFAGIVATRFPMAVPTPSALWGLGRLRLFSWC